jgi:ABC-type nickel/cobalt efflux system permease component RcnA
MRLYKFVALILLGVVSLWAQSGTTPAPTTDPKAPAAKTAPAADHDHAAMHKGCKCEHAKDAKK